MKYLKLLLLTSIITCLGFAVSSPMERFISLLQEMEVKFTPEKTYIHTDKPFYTTGETIWLKGYLINGVSHEKTKKSNVLHVELINSQDSILVKQKLYIDDNTFGAAGDIEIPKEWESGDYQLRAYTQYMKNEDTEYFFRKSIRIHQQKTYKKEDAFTEIAPTPKLESVLAIKKEATENLEDLKVSFYAESGVVIEGVENKFGVKALDKNANGALIQGAIKEKGKDEIIVMFRTFDFGLGMFSFVPKKGVEYIAEVDTKNSKKIFELPVTETNAQNLSIKNNNDGIILNVNSDNQALANFFIIGHLRGKVFYSKMISKNKNNYSTKLVTKGLTSGVAHFTLFEPSGKPVCERLVFIDNTDQQTQSNISFSKKEIGKRERQNININIISGDAKKQNANLSLSVTQKSAVPLSTRENIKSWLLLNSDLRGKVANAAVFFDLKKPIEHRKYLMESLLLTHGWRRFNWKNLLAESYKKTQKFKSEEGIFIKGRTTPLKQEFEKQFALTSITFLGGDFFTAKMFTDKNGRFEYGPFIVQDSVKTILQAEIKDVDEIDSRKVDIYLDADPTAPKISTTPPSQNDLEELYFDNYLKMQDYIGQLEFTFEGINALNEVLITTKKEPKINGYDDIASDLSIYGNPSHRLIIDSIPGTGGLSVFDLVGRLPGVQLRGGYPDQSLIIRGVSSFTASTDPLYIIDGVEVGPEFVQSIQASEVSFIDVLKGNDAAIYGSRAAGGVVAIYLVRPTDSDISVDSPGVISFVTSPFYKAKKFYAPDYFKPTSDPKPDYRTTLHWNPNLNTISDQQLNEHFYTGDQTGIFQVEIEGITENGELIYAVDQFEVVENNN